MAAHQVYLKWKRAFEMGFYKGFDYCYYCCYYYYFYYYYFHYYYYYHCYCYYYKTVL